MPDVSTMSQGGFDHFLNSRLSNAENETINNLIEMQSKIENGEVHTGERPFTTTIKQLRTGVIQRYIKIKTELNSEILRSMQRASNMDELAELRQMHDEVEKETARKNRAREEIRLVERTQKNNDYELYLRYTSDMDWRGRTKREADPITVTVGELFQKFLRKKILFFILGALVSFACAAADFTIIEAVLLAANLPRSTAVYSSIIAAIVLDFPPYILGFLITSKQDRRRMEEIDGAEIKVVESAAYKTSIVLLIIAISFFIISYIFMRLLMFLGGGDFNAAFHAVLQGDFQFVNSRFNSADVLSIFIPLATSAVAYAISFLLAVHYTDFVQGAIITIKEKLEERAASLQNDIHDSDAIIRSTNATIAEKESTLWASFHSAALPDDISENEFITDLVQTYRTITIPQFLQEYRFCSQRIRQSAEADIPKINRHLEKYIYNINDIGEMSISDEEEELLNAIWSDDADNQGSATRLTLEQISHIADTYLELYNS